MQRSFKVSVLGSHVGPGLAKTDSFLCPPAHGPLLKVLWQVQVSSSAVFFLLGSSSHFSETVDGDLFATAGTQAGRPPLLWTPYAVSGWEQSRCLSEVEGLPRIDAPRTMCSFR